MSKSHTLQGRPRFVTAGNRRTSSRRRPVARRTTPLLLEHLERRDLLAALPAPDLVSWYRAEGNAFDFADGNNGSLMNGATFAAGKVGQAFSFDGIDDLVNVPYSADLDIQQSLTLDAWVNPSASNSLPGGTVIVGRPFGYQLGILSNGHVAFGFPSGGSAAVNAVVQSSSSIPLNAFTHVAVTFDSSTGQANMYVNGALENTAVAAGPINSMVAPLQIGGFSDPGFTGGFFQGLIDEVDAFDRALSPEEIQAIVSAGGEGKATIVVDTAADTSDPLDGVTSLREAISQSNATAGRDAIGFSIPRPSTNDLVSWWKAEGNTNDSTGANAGTMQNGATFAPGRYGQAFSLDGTDDFVQFPDAANLDGMSQLTVDAWVRFNALPSGKEQFILSKAAAVGVGSNSYAFWLQGDTMRLTAAVETTSGLLTLQAPEAFTDTTSFHHVALTYDGATARFFVDGVLKNSAPLSGSILNTSYAVLIGRRSGPGVDGNGDAFNGLVDEAGISNRALSDAEIQALASGARAISPSSALPVITDPVVVDGYTQPGAALNTLTDGNNAVLKVGLDGTNAGSADGLSITGSGSTVRGLAIGNFSGDGVHLASSDNVVEGNFIGTDTSGMLDHGNSGDGVGIASAAAAQTIYSNDFENSVGSEWSSTTTDVTPIGNRRFLGQFGSDTATLTLPAASVPSTTTAVTLSFDLFVIRTWDGNDTLSGSGPDRWSLTLGNGMSLLDTTFSNNHPNSGIAGQAYPGVFGSGQFAPQTGASEVNTLGFLLGNDEFDSVYHLSFTFSYTGGDVVLRFGAALTTPGPDESWGLDNVEVATTASAFSAPNDFSLATNPNGAWSYGYTTSLGGAFHPYPDSSTHSSGLQVWIDNSIQSLGAPSVAYNPTASPTGDCCVVQPGQLAFHPGPNGEQSIVRWTAPADDTVKLAASFVGIDGSPTTTDPHVLHNGISIFDGTVNRLHAGPYFETTLAVHAGDTIDFAIGNGGNGFFSDSSALDAVITSSTGGSAHNNTVGGLAPAQQNVIADNGTGVAIAGNSTGNPILGNSIFTNDGLGIDLGSDGLTPNDSGDGDSGPNDLQNTPAIATLSSSLTELSVAGSIDSAPSSAYRIEFFASDDSDPSGSGEGRRFLGALRVTTDASGHAAVDHVLPPVSDAQWITATATLLTGAGDTPVETSEFSAAIQAHLQVHLATIQFTATHYDVIEGQQFAVLTVVRTGGIGTSATVDFTTADGSAGQRQIRAGSLRAEDYTTTAGTLVFRRGMSQREIQIPIHDDSIIEPDELFHVVLSNPSTGLTLADNSTADVTIHDNDPTVQFTATSSKRGESATGRSQIQVQLTPASNQTVTVAYAAVGGTATFNQDYRPAGGTLTFRPGETSKFINFTTINDALYEGDETVLYELSSPSHAFLGDQTRYKVTIVDDDPQPPPADPGSTPATALFIDLQTVPNQSYVQNLRPTDRDVFRVHLTAGENLAIDVDPVKFGLTTQQLATSTLVVIAPDGQTPLATIGASPEPDTGLISGNPAYLFHATDTGDYYLRLQTTQTGVSGYRIWFHLVGGVSEHVPAPDLLNAPGSMYAWFDGQDTVGITGPTGYGFTLEGPWQQQVTSAGKSVLMSQTLTLPIGSRLTLRSPQGVDLPLIANGPIVISTNKQRWGNVFGVVSTSAINFPVSLGIDPINDLLAQAFGSNIVAVGLLSGDWRISLGGKTLAVRGRNTTSTIDPLLDGVPYLRQKGPINFNAQLGKYSLDYSVIDKPVDWAFDPGDPMLYLKVDDAGPVKKPALALSMHGLLEYNPLDAPSPLIDAGVTHFYGQVYETAQIPFKIGPVPLKIVADEVFNIDADRDGHVLGDLRNAGDLLDVFQGDFSEVRAVLDDIQFGANGQLFLDIKDPQLEFELGDASVVFNGLEESLWVRGQQGGANPLAGTPLAQFNSGTTVILEGLISLNGDFLLSTTTVQDIGLADLTYAITITNHGIFAHVEGRAEFGVSIDTPIGSASGKAIADLQADVSIDIDDDGDVHLSGSVSASGKLVAGGHTLFSGSISASVKSRGFRFKFPKGVGDINLNVI